MVTQLIEVLFLAPLFSQLPKPVLGALIIEAVVMGMMNVPEMRRIYRVQRFDFWVAIVAILGTLAFGVLAGVILGIGLSLLWLIAVATHPQMPTLGREPGTQVFRDVIENPDDEQIPGVAVVRLDGGTVNPGAQSDWVNFSVDWPYLTGFDELLSGTVGRSTAAHATAATLADIRLLQARGLFLLDVLLHLVDQREHVAHAQNARCEPVRIKRLEGVELLADAGEQDGFADHLADR